MSDNREAILARLFEVLSQTPGINGSARNDLTVPESMVPFIVMLDGDENTDERDFQRGNRPPFQPNVVQMAPEVYLVLDEKPETVGPRLNYFMALIKYRVLNDSQLRTLAKDGDIRYEGCQPALGLGRSMEGEMGLNFTIVRMADNKAPPELETE